MERKFNFNTAKHIAFGLPQINRQTKDIDSQIVLIEAQRIYNYVTKNADKLDWVNKNGLDPQEPYRYYPVRSGPQIFTDSEIYHANLGLNLPFNPHIGPGNSIGEPSSHLDDDARDHDIAYEHGDAIAEADEIFIKKNLDHFFDSDTNVLDKFASGVGALGIQAKKSFESVAGQQYPSEYV